MPANVAGGETPFSSRGVAGGWRDRWDDLDDHAELRVQAAYAEIRQLATAQAIGRVWQSEIREERRQIGRP